MKKLLTGGLTNSRTDGRRTNMDHNSSPEHEVLKVSYCDPQKPKHTLHSYGSKPNKFHQSLGTKFGLTTWFLFMAPCFDKMIICIKLVSNFIMHDKVMGRTMKPMQQI